jgi:hypothetical protein
MVVSTKQRYRRWGSMKGTQELRARVCPDVFTFFNDHATDREGKRRSRGKTLELLVELVEQLADPLLDSAPEYRYAICSALLDDIAGIRR